MPRIGSKTSKIVLTGVNIGDYGKENLETKTRTYFLVWFRELDKVEGIERLQFRPLSLIY
jgi:tRNA A37 methylthiotransferase MiaB